MLRSRRVPPPPRRLASPVVTNLSTSASVRPRESFVLHSARARTFESCADFPGNPAIVTRLAKWGFYLECPHTKPYSVVCHFCKYRFIIPDGWQHSEMLEHFHPESTAPSCSHVQDVRKCIHMQRGLSARLHSFAEFGWSAKRRLPTAESLARAGFFCLESGATKCAFCKGVITEWREGDIPIVVHAHRFVCCPYILDPPSCALEDDVVTTHKSPEAAAANGSDHPSESYGIRHQRPVYQNMITLQARLETFRHKAPRLSAKKCALADAGFFALSVTDTSYVKCFHCGGGIKEWPVDAQPWHEHARWFPRCEYLRLVKGDAFVRMVASSHTKEDVVVVVDAPAKPINDLENELDLIMESENAQKYIRRGYDSRIVRSALKQFMRDHERGFEFSEEFEQILLSVSRMRGDILSKEHAASGASSSSSSSHDDDATATNEALLCKVCQVAEREIVFFPCAHILCCGVCSASLECCPICQKDIQRVLRVYIS